MYSAVTSSPGNRCSNLFLRLFLIDLQPNGSVVGIVESQRIGNKVTQRTLLNLGADFPLAEEQWPILTKRILEILHGHRSLLEIHGEIEKWARNYAARIIAKQQEESGDNS